MREWARVGTRAWAETWPFTSYCPGKLFSSNFTRNRYRVQSHQLQQLTDRRPARNHNQQQRTLPLLIVSGFDMNFRMEILDEHQRLHVLRPTLQYRRTSQQPDLLLISAMSKRTPQELAASQDSDRSSLPRK